MTLRLYAEKQGWSLSNIEIRLSHEHLHAKDCAECDVREDAFLDVIRRHILLTGTLDAEQKARLAMVADRCPVHKTLMGLKRILTDVQVATA